MDKILYILLRVVCWLIRLWPPGVQTRVLGLIARVGTKSFSRFDRIARQNLCLAFPERGEAWYNEVLADSHRSLAQLFVDFIRLEDLDREWVAEHVEHSALAEIEKVSPATADKGIIFASGHLGSFELLGHSLAVLRRPLCFVAREFHNRPLNSWWQTRRRLSGNETISNRGAYKPILQRIQAGRDVAIPIDQNVKQGQAVFVNWFSHLAATSGAPARAALKTGAALVVVSIGNEPNERYRIKAVPCDYSDIHHNANLCKEEKVRQITQRISDSFCQMISEEPGQWFWLHRRWKSAPAGGVRSELYSS